MCHSMSAGHIVTQLDKAHSFKNTQLKNCKGTCYMF